MERCAEIPRQARAAPRGAGGQPPRGHLRASNAISRPLPEEHGRPPPRGAHLHGGGSPQPCQAGRALPEGLSTATLIMKTQPMSLAMDPDRRLHGAVGAPHAWPGESRLRTGSHLLPSGASPTATSSHRHRAGAPYVAGGAAPLVPASPWLHGGGYQPSSGDARVPVGALVVSSGRHRARSGALILSNGAFRTHDRGASLFEAKRRKCARCHGGRVAVRVATFAFDGSGSRARLDATAPPPRPSAPCPAASGS